jgi:hypothetical protein
LLDITKVPVYYIGDSNKNYLRLEGELRRAGFENIKKSPSVINTDKKVGVAKAHVLALQTALSQNKGPFIILEDDVSIDDFQREINLPENTDAIYLGLSRWGLRAGKGEVGISGIRHNSGLYRMYNMLAAHAILYVNHDYAQFILDSIPIFIEMETNQDKLRAETMKYWNIYATRNPVFYQQGRYEKHTRFRLSGQIMLPLKSFYS